MTSRTLRIVLASALIGVLMVVALLGRFRNPDRSAESATPTTEPVAPLSVEVEFETPDLMVDDSVIVTRELPVELTRFTRDEMGARTAAVAYLEATEDVIAMTPAQAAAAQRAISTDASADRLAARVEEEMVDVIALTPQGIRVWVAPMEARSVAVDDGYEVSIWYAEVIAIGTDSTFDNWRTVTYSLVWEHDTWLIDDSVSVVGPVPSRSAGLAVTPPAALVSTLALFDDEGMVP